MESNLKAPQTNRQRFDKCHNFKYDGSDYEMRLDTTPHGQDYVSILMGGGDWIFGGTIVKYSTHGVVLDLFGELVVCEFEKMLFE